MNVKFTVTQRDKLDSIPITNGQLLYLADENLAYYDMLNNRLCINGMRLVDGMPDTGYEQILYIDVSTDPWACYLWNGEEEKFEPISGALATDDSFGIVKPDGITIVVNEGVISAKTSAIGTTYIPDVTSGTKLGTIIAGGTSVAVYAPTTTFTQTVTNGTEIAKIMADGEVKSVYAPTSTFTQDVSSGTRIGRIMTDGTTKAIYAPTSTFTQIQPNGTEIGRIMADGTTSSIYAPTTTFTPSATRGAKIGEILADGTSYSLYAPIATSGNVGVVKPDNVTVTINSDGSLVAATSVIGSTFIPTVTSGTELGKIVANGSTRSVYAPTTTFTKTVTSGTEIGKIMADGTVSSIYAPTVNNATLTIQRNGTTVKTFTANASANVTANIQAVTSVATGNGLKGGTITTSGTISTNVPRVAKSCNSLPGTNSWILEEYTAGTAYNLPSNAWYYIFSMQGSDASYGAQLALGMTTGAAYYREYNAKTWGGWKSIINVQPSVGNGTLTIQRNGSNVATFTANQSGNATANISVPTNNNQLTNGAGYITSASVGNGTLTIQRNSSNVATFTANQSGNATANISVPTKTSELSNDSGFIAATVVSTVLYAGWTSVTLNSAVITTSSTLAIYADDPMLTYTGASVGTGYVTLWFNAQSSNKTIKVYVM